MHSGIGRHKQMTDIAHAGIHKINPINGRFPLRKNRKRKNQTEKEEEKSNFFHDIFNLECQIYDKLSENVSNLLPKSNFI
jgi:hypothetical protein